MAKTEMYPIERKMGDDNLNRLIRSLERSTQDLNRLFFIRYDMMMILLNQHQERSA